MKKNLGLEPVTVKCHFKKNEKAMPPVECKLDVKSFEGTVAVEVPIAKVAKEIENISKTIHDIATGFSKLNVQVTEMPEIKVKDSGEDKV